MTYRKAGAKAARARRLLATTALSGAALLSASGMRPALACADNATGATFGSVSNSAAIDCISVSNATVTGNVTNTSTGTLTAGTGISISSGTMDGAVVNNGNITSGGISIGNQATILGGISNSGVIANNVDVEFLPGGTFGGGITNTGTIGGILINFSSGPPTSGTFSGGITNSGAIMGSSGVGISMREFSTFAGGITNSGTISAAILGIEILAYQTFMGGITNRGTITANGTAIVVGGGTFMGGITNTGTISGGAAILDGASNAQSVFDSGTIIGTGGTAVQFLGSGGNTFTLGPSYSITGNVLGAGSDTFQLGGTGAGTFNLALIGASQQYQGFTTFNEVGSATWTVTGTFGQTNPWTVQSGTLLVNGDLSAASLTTVTGGTLGGTGRVGNTQIDSGGTFAPGTPGVPGTSITVAGNLAFQSGALYLVQLNPTTATIANVTGTASLNGNALAAFAPGSYAVKQYDILHSAGLNGTTFGSLGTTNLPANFTASLSYTPTDVFLNLKASLAAGIDQPNGNQQSVANALNNFFNNGGTLTPNFLSIFGLTGGNLKNALSQLSGEAAADGDIGAFAMMTSFLGLMLDPSVDGRGGAGGAGGGAIGFAPDDQAGLPLDIASAYDTVLKSPEQAAPSFDRRWSAWGSGFGGTNKTDGDAAVGSNTVTTNAYGFASGMDYHVSPDTVAGFALAGGGTNWGLAQGLGGGRSDAFQAGVYGTTHFGPAYLATALAFANHWITTNRVALGDQLTANFEGQSYAARVEGGYRISAGRTIGVTSYGALQAQEFRTPAYSESDLSGGGFGLSYNAMSATDTRSELGVRFDDPTLVGGMPLILFGRAAWAHDWVSNPSLDATFESLPGASFTVNGAPIPKNSALTSAGAQLFLTANWSLLAKFYGEFAPGSQTYAGTATVRYTW